MLDGAKFVCLDENGDPFKTIEAKGRKFSIGYLMDCDHIIGDNEEAEKIHCQIECDAFGHVTICNKSEKNPIIVNGETVTLKRTLFNNSKIRILDKEYLWQHKTTACSVDVVSENPEEMVTPVKQLGIPEQPPSSCPALRHHRDLPKRFTVHNLRAYRVDSDANVTIDNDKSNKQHETSSAQSEIEHTDSQPSTFELDTTPAKVDLVDSTSNKKTSSTEKRLKSFRSICGWSGMTTTSYSPRETGVRIEKTFTAIIPPTTPRSSLCRTPKGLLESLHLQGERQDSSNQLSFATPSKKPDGQSKQGIVVQHVKSAMKIVDLTTPSKLHAQSSLARPISNKKSTAVKSFVSFSENNGSTIDTTGVTALSVTPQLMLNDTPLSSASVISVDSTDPSVVSGVTDASVVTSTTPLRTQLTAASGLRKQALLASVKTQVSNSILKTPHSPKTPSNLSLPVRNASTTGTPLTTTTKSSTTTKVIHSETAKNIKSHSIVATTKKNPVIRRLDVSTTKRPSSPVSRTSQKVNSTTILTINKRNSTATPQISIDPTPKKDFSKISGNESSILTTSTPYKLQTDEQQNDSPQLDAAVEFFSVLHSSNDEENSLKEHEKVSTSVKESSLKPTDAQSSKKSISENDDLMKEIEEILNTSDELRKQLQTTVTIAENEDIAEEVSTEPISRTSSTTPVQTEIESTTQTTPSKNSLSASILLKAINSVDKNKPKTQKEDEEKENKVNECIDTPVRRRISLSAAGPSISVTPAISEEISTVTGTPLTPKRVTKRRPSISLDTDEVAAAHISQRIIDTYNTENMGAIIEEEADAVPLMAEHPEGPSAGSVHSDNMPIKLPTHSNSDAKVMLETPLGEQKEDIESVLSNDEQIEDASMSPLHCSDESFAEPVNGEELEELENDDLILQTSVPNIMESSSSRKGKEQSVSKESAQPLSETFSIHESNVEDEMLDESFGEIEHVPLEAGSNETIKKTLGDDDKKKDVNTTAEHLSKEQLGDHNSRNVTLDESFGQVELIGHNEVSTSEIESNNTTVKELPKEFKNGSKLTTKDTIEILDSSFETSAEATNSKNLTEGITKENEIITTNIDQVKEESKDPEQQKGHEIIEILDSSVDIPVVEDYTIADKLCLVQDESQHIAGTASPQLFEVIAEKDNFNKESDEVQESLPTSTLNKNSLKENFEVKQNISTNESVILESNKVNEAEDLSEQQIRESTTHVDKDCNSKLTASPTETKSDNINKSLLAEISIENPISDQASEAQKGIELNSSDEILLKGEQLELNENDEELERNSPSKPLTKNECLIQGNIKRQTIVLNASLSRKSQVSHSKDVDMKLNKTTDLFAETIVKQIDTAVEIEDAVNTFEKSGSQETLEEQHTESDNLNVSQIAYDKTSDVISPSNEAGVVENIVLETVPVVGGSNEAVLLQEVAKEVQAELCNILPSNEKSVSIQKIDVQSSAPEQHILNEMDKELKTVVDKSLENENAGEGEGTSVSIAEKSNSQYEGKEIEEAANDKETSELSELSGIEERLAFNDSIETANEMSQIQTEEECDELHAIEVTLALNETTELATEKVHSSNEPKELKVEEPNPSSLKELSMADENLSPNDATDTSIKHNENTTAKNLDETEKLVDEVVEDDVSMHQSEALAIEEIKAQSFNISKESESVNIEARNIEEVIVPNNISIDVQESIENKSNEFEQEQPIKSDQYDEEEAVSENLNKNCDTASQKVVEASCSHKPHAGEQSAVDEISVLNETIELPDDELDQLSSKILIPVETNEIEQPIVSTATDLEARTDGPLNAEEISFNESVELSDDELNQPSKIVEKVVESTATEPEARTDGPLNAEEISFNETVELSDDELDQPSKIVEKVVEAIVSTATEPEARIDGPMNDQEISLLNETVELSGDELNQPSQIVEKVVESTATDPEAQTDGPLIAEEISFNETVELSDDELDQPSQIVEKVCQTIEAKNISTMNKATEQETEKVDPSIWECDQTQEKSKKLQQSEMGTTDEEMNMNKSDAKEEQEIEVPSEAMEIPSTNEIEIREEKQQYVEENETIKTNAEETNSAADKEEIKQVATVNQSDSSGKTEATTETFEASEIEDSITPEANEATDVIITDLDAVNDRTCEKQDEFAAPALDKEHDKPSELMQESEVVAEERVILNLSDESSTSKMGKANASEESEIVVEQEAKQRDEITEATKEKNFEILNESVQSDENINETDENFNQGHEASNEPNVSTVEANNQTLNEVLVENLPDLILDLNKEEMHQMKIPDQIDAQNPNDENIELTNAEQAENFLEAPNDALDKVVQIDELIEDKDIVDNDLNVAEKSQKSEEIQLDETKEDKQITPQKIAEKSSAETKENEAEAPQEISEIRVDGTAENEISSAAEFEVKEIEQLEKTNEAIDEKVEKDHQAKMNTTEVIPETQSVMDIPVAEVPEVELQTVHSDEIKENEQETTQEIDEISSVDKELPTEGEIQIENIENTKKDEIDDQAAENAAQVEYKWLHADKFSENEKNTTQSISRKSVNTTAHQELHLDENEDDRQTVKSIVKNASEKISDLDEEHNIEETQEPVKLVDKGKETKRRPTKTENKEKKPRRERQVRGAVTKANKMEQMEIKDNKVDSTDEKDIEETAVSGSDLQVVKEMPETIDVHTAEETVTDKAVGQEIIQQATPSETKEQKPRRVMRGRALSTVVINDEKEDLAKSNQPETNEITKADEISQAHQPVQATAVAKKAVAKQKTTKERKPRRGKQAEVVSTTAESVEQETIDEIKITEKDQTEEAPNNQEEATQKEDQSHDRTKTLEVPKQSVQSADKEETHAKTENVLDASSQRSLRRRAAVHSYEISSDSEQEMQHTSSSSRKRRAVKNTPKQAKTASVVETIKEDTVTNTPSTSKALAHRASRKKPIIETASENEQPADEHKAPTPKKRGRRKAEPKATFIPLNEILPDIEITHEKTLDGTKNISAIEATLEISAAGKLPKEKKPTTLRGRAAAKKTVKHDEETDEAEHDEELTLAKTEKLEAAAATRPASRRGAKKGAKAAEAADHDVEEATITKSQKRTTTRRGKNAKIEELNNEMESLKDDDISTSHKHAAEETAAEIEAPPKTAPKRKGKLTKSETVTEKSDAIVTEDTTELPTKRRRRLSVQSEQHENTTTSTPPAVTGTGTSTTRKPRARRGQHVDDGESVLTTDETENVAKSAADHTQEEENVKKPRIGRRGKQAETVDPVINEKKRKQTKTTTHESDEKQEEVEEILQVESTTTHKTTRGRNAKKSESSEVITSSRRKQTKAPKATVAEKADSIAGDDIEQEREVETPSEETATKKTSGKRQKQVELPEAVETTKTVRSQRRKHVHFNEEPTNSAVANQAEATETVEEVSNETATLPKRRRRR